MKLRVIGFFGVGMLLFFLSAALAQTGPPEPGGRRTDHAQARMDPVVRLNRTLESAGAGPLSDQQEQELTTLAGNFKAAHQQLAADPELQNAKRALEEAILSRDEGQIDQAAGAVAAQVSNRTRTMIRDVARFQMQVLSILTEEQVNALRTQYGNSGLVHTLGSLAGWGFHGRMGGGPRG